MNNHDYWLILLLYEGFSNDSLQHKITIEWVPQHHVVHYREFKCGYYNILNFALSANFTFEGNKYDTVS